MSVVSRLDTVIGAIRADTPRMASMLKRLEPIMFPSAISTLLFFKASTEVVSSGRDVPIATMTLPTNVWLRPS